MLIAKITKQERSKDPDLMTYYPKANAFIDTKDNLFQKKESLQSMTKDLHQGDCIHLQSSQDLFQVIGIDDEHKKCWVRRWPLLPNGSPVFEVSMQQIALGS